MEAKVFEINGQWFKRSACSHYFVKQGEKFVKVKKTDYLVALDNAQRPDPITPATCLVKFIGTIPKGIARKLTRRYAKGKKSALTWFAECEAISGLTHSEIKRHLKAV